MDYGGASEEDLKPFRLREDATLRDWMEAEGPGTESYAGNEVASPRCNGKDEECLIDCESTEGFPVARDEVPMVRRQGGLWDFANRLAEDKGLVWTQMLQREPWASLNPCQQRAYKGSEAMWGVNQFVQFSLHLATTTMLLQYRTNLSLIKF